MVKYQRPEYKITTIDIEEQYAKSILLLPNPYGREIPYNGSYFGRDPLLFIFLFEGESSY
jgi:hypothetical protein